MFESMSDGIAGLVGLALSLACIPPRFAALLSPLTPPASPLLKAVVCTHCRVPGGSGNHICVSECLSDDFAIKSDSLKTRRRD